MRIIFMGTPILAAQCLTGLAQAGYEIPLVVTQPDRPKGRGKRLACSPVKQAAINLGIEVYQPVSLRNDQAQQVLQEIAADLIVVAAFGQILPKAVLDLPKLGCINVHASLLPAYRGAAPIQWVMLNGEIETGISIMLMEEGLDTGPVLIQRKINIPEEMTGGQLYDSLALLGTEALLEAIPLWAAGEIKPIKQQAELSSYAIRLEREHEKIAWNKTANQIYNQIRTFNPWPGAFTFYNDKEVKILAADKINFAEVLTLEKSLLAKKPNLIIAPGTILAIIRKSGPVVKTGQGALLIKQVQPVGKQLMDAVSFVNGYRLTEGDLFT